MRVNWLSCLARWVQSITEQANKAKLWPVQYINPKTSKTLIIKAINGNLTMLYALFYQNNINL